MHTYELTCYMSIKCTGEVKKLKTKKKNKKAKSNNTLLCKYTHNQGLLCVYNNEVICAAQP